MGFLGTFLGKSLGTTLGTDTAPTITLAATETYLARNLFSWMRADYRTEAGGKVTQFNDKVQTVAEGAVAPNARSVDPAHAYAQASAPAQVAAITTDATLNAEGAVFTGAEFYDSTIAASNWTFVHNQSGSTVVQIWVPKAPASAFDVPWSTAQTGAANFGVDLYRDQATPTVLNFRVRGANTNPVVSTGWTLNVATCMRVSVSSAQSPGLQIFRNRVSAGTSTMAAPVVVTAEAPFRIAASVVTAVNKSTMVLADMLIAKSVSAAMLEALDRYVSLRYPTIA